MRQLPEALATLLHALPREAVLVFTVLLGALVIWKILQGRPAREVRAAVRRARQADPGAEAREAEDHALSLAGRDVRLLELLAREALRHHRKGLALRAVEALEDVGAPPRVRQPLEVRLGRTKKKKRGPVDAGGEARVVRRLRRQGLDALARDRLQAALKRFPGDPDLLRLQERRASEG